MLHGSPLELHVAIPTVPVSGTVVLYATGDGGWFGAAVDMFRTIAAAGFRTVGFSSRAFLLVTLLSAATATAAAAAPAETTETLLLRGHAQTLHLYDTRGGTPVIVSSGDGGWIHLGPHVAEALARHGFFVIGFDAKAYLSSFTTNHSTLRPDDEPGDYKVLADFAAGGGRRRPILVGVSEGAGLSVLAATDPATRAAIGGVVGLGLPDINELGWRWKDAIIYVTQAPARQTALRVADRSCWPLRCACWRSPSRLAAPSRYGEP